MPSACPQGFRADIGAALDRRYALSYSWASPLRPAPVVSQAGLALGESWLGFQPEVQQLLSQSDGPEAAAAAQSRLEGPQVPDKAVVQADVDALLALLGF